MAAKLRVLAQHKPVEFDGFATQVQFSIFVTVSSFSQNEK